MSVPAVPSREESAVSARIRLEALESRLLDRGGGISGAFLAADGLRRSLASEPSAATLETVAALFRLLDEDRHAQSRQALFLYRAGADALTALVRHVPGGMGKAALATLSRILVRGTGPVHRACAEALGDLPLDMAPPPGPDIPDSPPSARPALRLDDLPGRLGSGLKGNLSTITAGASHWMGRSRVTPLSGDRVLVVKTAVGEEAAAGLAREAAWMDWLRARPHLFPASCEIPAPLALGDGHVFRLLDPETAGRSAIAFVTRPSYFVYPNDHRPGMNLPEETFRAVMTRAALLLGALAGQGLVHAAVIPLFHNRVQAHRREDRGIYLWRRGGRLDQWLASCRHPNFGSSGLRDFEHLEIARPDGRGLYDTIGDHLLSLLLVLGSHFRHRRPDLVGWTVPPLSPTGESGPPVPVDARHLFDPESLRNLVDAVFAAYYRGFTGVDLPAAAVPDTSVLASRMREEMGVDRHMEEILRQPDQERMTDAEFRDHLRNRGVADAEIREFRRGEREIVLRTGPHLGGFNQRISLPEMIHFLETASALCVAGRFREDRGGGAAPVP